MRALLLATLLVFLTAACYAPQEWITRGDDVPVVCAKVILPAHEVVGHYRLVDGIWQRRADTHEAQYVVEVDSMRGRRIVLVTRAVYERLGVGDPFWGEVR